MKTIVLHVPNEADEARVLAALRDLQQQTPFYLESETLGLPDRPLTPDEIEVEILEARQGQPIALAQARQQFGV